MKKLLFLLIIPLIFLSCSEEKKLTRKELFTHKSAAEIQQRILQIEKAKKTAVKAFVKELPLEQKIAQLFLENLEGNSHFIPVENFSSVDKAAPNEPMIAGGYIFFSYNLAEKPEEIMSFISNIRSFAINNNQIPPFISADQEGGLVNRLKNISGPLPSQERVSSKMTAEQAKELYSLQAKQMALLGFNLNIAPVAEACTDDNKIFLNKRSFGTTQQVIDYGSQCINAYQENGIGTVLKHFPGNTNTDPHTGLPVISLNKAEIEKMTEPFEKLIKENPEGVLMSHAITSAIDSKTPSCLSRYWVTDILRNKFGYEGVIFSDDIFMGALADNGFPPELAAVKAIESGVDCIMISEKRFAAPAKILYQKAENDSEFLAKVEKAVERIIQYKINARILYLKDNLDGTYSVTANDFTISENAAASFEELKKQNQKLYQQYFIN